MVLFCGHRRDGNPVRRLLRHLEALSEPGGTEVPSRRRLAYAVCMAGTDKRKQSLYFPEEMLKEIGAEATRQDRSLSWIVQKAWKVARKDIMNMPSVEGLPGDPASSDTAK